MSHYPFSAIVGQHKLKQALLLCAVNPAIGGVLIKGEKGTAKTTATRGLSAVMPQIERIADSLFNTSQKEFLEDHPESEPVEFQLETIQVPFVDLPIGASEDRVMGSLDLQAIVSEKKKKFLPGLLAGAHRGILYIDEVNLLPDHLVDILLDVAASGVNKVQREGLSISHPSRFVLIGTMNPEEGNLRPQFLDRFGLMVEVEAQLDVRERTEVVKRRMAFEKDAENFTSKWTASQQALKEQITTAQQLLSHVTMPEGLLTMISQLCIEWSVASLRADIVLYKTAVTLAAMAGRVVVAADDVKKAAEFVLVHRKGKKPFDQNRNKNSEAYENADSQTSDPSPPVKSKEPAADQETSNSKNSVQECGDEESCPPDSESEVFAIGTTVDVPVLTSDIAVIAPQLLNGRRSEAVNTPKGFQMRAKNNAFAEDIAISETIQNAISRDSDNFRIEKEDIHQKIRHGKTGHLILFVVDASGSMAAGKRMQAVKGSVLSLLKDAYQKRDMVGVISFRGIEAEILLEPTTSAELAKKTLENLPTGGRTPLAHALQLADNLLNEFKNSQPILVILSDGKANVGLPGGGDPWLQTLQLCASIRQRNVLTLVLDTENGYLRLGRAAELAKSLEAEYLSLDDLTSERITKTISGKIESFIKV